MDVESKHFACPPPPPEIHVEPSSTCFHLTFLTFYLHPVPSSSTSAPRSRDTTVKVWHVPTATEQKNLGGHTGGVTCLSAPPLEYCKELGERRQPQMCREQLSNAGVLSSGNYRSSLSETPQ